METKDLIAKIEALPPESKLEVERFVDSLRWMLDVEEKTMQLKWVGALEHLKDQYTSVDLQHESLKWWGT